ncbi:MAG: hypothetical protein IJ776_07850 [Paludibacteraceae bacterium]|nr:hypothetical protein [Paludibacteraceae bacterium]
MKKVLFVLAIAACTVACTKKAENKECGEEQKPCCEQKCAEQKAEPAAAVATEEEKTLQETAEDAAKKLINAGAAKAADEINK